MGPGIGRVPSIRLKLIYRSAKVPTYSSSFVQTDCTALYLLHIHYINIFL
jgi:hypothetical protein